MGLVYISGFVIYAAVAIVVVYAVSRLASKHRALWASAWGLGFFLIPFWDLIPTLAAFHYYCKRDAGVEIRVPIDEWKRTNSELLSPSRQDSRAPATRVGRYLRAPLNQYIAGETLSPPEPMFLTVARLESRVIDVRTDAVLARLVNFRSGFPGIGDLGKGTWKLWLSRESCWQSQEASPASQYEQFRRSIRQ